MTGELLQQIAETLARAYRQGGELSLMAELNANNGKVMILLRESETCFDTYDIDRKGVFYQFEAIFSPHRTLGIPIPQETLTE